MPSGKDHFAHYEHLKIPLEAIKLATNNFGDNKQIGKGGFGKVYNGELVHSGKQVTVAVKRLDPTFGQGNPEFWKEIIMLSRFKHDNLVSLLGFSDEGDGEKLLVYEYLSNQSLDRYLSCTHLSWIQRLNICIGVARGLEYLHNPARTNERVFHCDIKSSNILLDQNWNAKISDFGLSKFAPANQEFTFIITHGVGTIGYIDPVYAEKGVLTKESDIYSFGVVLFEVLSGRLCFRNYDDGHPHRPLSELAQRYYEDNEIGAIVHECLREQIAPKCLDNFSQIAYQCLMRDRNERPLIAKIVKQLELALEYQVKYNFEKERKLKSHDEVEEDIEPLPLSIHHGVTSMTDGVTSMTEEQLKAYDGRDPGKPLLIAIKGQIYDVSRNRGFYEPAGPYAMFAGKDVSKALAKRSFGEKDLNEDINDPSPFELDILKDWQERFTSKYAKVGFIARWKNMGKNQIS